MSADAGAAGSVIPRPETGSGAGADSRAAARGEAASTAVPRSMGVARPGVSVPVRGVDARGGNCGATGAVVDGAAEAGAASATDAAGFDSAARPGVDMSGCGARGAVAGASGLDGISATRARDGVSAGDARSRAPDTCGEYGKLDPWPATRSG